MRSTAGGASAVASTRSTVGFTAASADDPAMASVLVTTVFGLAAPRRRRTLIFGGGVDNAVSEVPAARVGGATASNDPLTKVNRLNTLPVSTIIGVRS